MNNDDPHIEALAALPQPFPNWPPNSGGYPVLTPELGPILSPYPYGFGQTANISTAPPAPQKLATKYPMGMPAGATGQNQNQKLPDWPHAKFNVLPDKAPPSLSQIP